MMPGSGGDTSPLPTADQCELLLRRHVLDVWFPRSVDREYGGFLCDFDRRWRSSGRQHKLLEFQARQTLLAAEASRAYPNDRRLHEAAVHGFRFLGERMWDADAGGWFHMVDRAGHPLAARTKHVHGAAYAIQACVAVHETTGDSGALELAVKGFGWLERCARDPEHPGYFGFLRQDGTVIRDESDCPWHAGTDLIGVPVGYKDLNVHSDLLETFFYLYGVNRDPRVGQRLNEMIEIACTKAAAPGGGLHYYCAPDWRPLPHLARYGTEFQTAFRLLLARPLAVNPELMQARACALTAHALRYGKDRHHGGFFYAGPGSEPASIEGEDVRVRAKAWWVQFEALKALLALSLEDPERADYRRELAALWSYIGRYLVDETCGGVYAMGLDSLPRWAGAFGGILAPPSATRKGHVWKDGSHDGRAWLHCASLLRAHPLPAARPLLPTNQASHRM